MARREESVSSLLMEIAGDFLKKKFQSDVLVSVTHVDVASDLKNASVFVSVYPETKQIVVMEVLKNEEKELRDYAKKFLKLRALPAFDFKLDKSAKAQQRIEELLGRAANDRWFKF